MNSYGCMLEFLGGIGAAMGSDWRLNGTVIIPNKKHNGRKTAASLFRDKSLKLKHFNNVILTFSNQRILHKYAIC